MIDIIHLEILNVSFVRPCAATAPVKADDAWGSPAPPSDSSPSGDPFGDGSKKDDAWGALSNTASNEQGKLMSNMAKLVFLTVVALANICSLLKFLPAIFPALFAPLDVSSKMPFI